MGLISGYHFFQGLISHDHRCNMVSSNWIWLPSGFVVRIMGLVSHEDCPLIKWNDNTTVVPAQDLGFEPNLSGTSFARSSKKQLILSVQFALRKATRHLSVMTNWQNHPKPLMLIMVNIPMCFWYATDENPGWWTSLKQAEEVPWWGWGTCRFPSFALSYLKSRIWSRFMFQNNAADGSHWFECRFTQKHD